MKISVVTVVFNAQNTIADALQSVAEQTHPDIEHIVIDGASTDGTMAVVKQYSDQLATVVSEPDGGIYDAMNKGIALATGDVIGILNADDVLSHPGVLSTVAATHEDPELDGCYADLVYVKQQDISKVVRYWRSRTYRPGLSFRGWMPAHPTLYLKRRVYENAGPYNTDLRYQADLEFCARVFETLKITTHYIPEIWVRMRLGGVTNNSVTTMWRGNWESYYALRDLGLNRNPFSYFLIKFGSKLPQFLHRQ